MYAIVESGGKQHRAEPEGILLVEKLAAEPGSAVELDRVALVEKDGKVHVGKPWLKGAKVTCRVVSHGRGQKLDVFTYKAKKNYKRKRGHRQAFTRLQVEKISLRSRKKVDEDGA
jgi:large subunit ribosomal protein L21